LISGATASFRAASSGTAPLGYQWYFNGTPLAGNGHISGSTTTNLTIANVQTNDAGSYVLMVANLFGSTNSSPATLAIHLWNEIWRRGNLNKNATYHPGSIYEKLKKKYLLSSYPAPTPAL